MSNAVSHDQNFKNLIVEYPRDALALFAADEAPGAEDATKVIPLRQEQLKERLGDRFRELDTPLLVEWPDGRREAVLFVLEAESDDRKFSIHRLAQYCLDLAVMLGTDRVVPVTIFLRGARAAPASLVLGTELRPYLTFDYLACALGEMSAEQWLDSDNLVARLNLPNMRSPAGQKVDVYGHAVRGLLDLEPDPGMREKYLKFIDTYAELTENELKRYRTEHPEEGRIVAGLTQKALDESWREGTQHGMEQGLQDGIQQGMRDGLEQGRVEGERTALERLLRRRFGRLSPEVDERLRGASADELGAWFDNVLDAETLEDVFNHGTDN